MRALLVARNVTAGVVAALMIAGCSQSAPTPDEPSTSAATSTSMGDRWSPTEVTSWTTMTGDDRDSSRRWTFNRPRSQFAATSAGAATIADLTDDQGDKWTALVVLDRANNRGTVWEPVTGWNQPATMAIVDSGVLQFVSVTNKTIAASFVDVKSGTVTRVDPTATIDSEAPQWNGGNVTVGSLCLTTDSKRWVTLKQPTLNEWSSRPSIQGAAAQCSRVVWATPPIGLRGWLLYRADRSGHLLSASERFEKVTNPRVNAAVDAGVVVESDNEARMFGWDGKQLGVTVNAATGLSGAQTPDGSQLIVADMHLAVAATGALVPATSPDPSPGTDRVFAVTGTGVGDGFVGTAWGHHNRYSYAAGKVTVDAYKDMAAQDPVWEFALPLDTSIVADLGDGWLWTTSGDADTVTAIRIA